MNLNLCMWKCINDVLGNGDIIFLLTLVVHVLLILISPLGMRITNGQNSTTMVAINLKVSPCRDIIAKSNKTKAYVVNPCDSCSTDINAPLNEIRVHIYSDYIISFECTCVIHQENMKALKCRTLGVDIHGP